MDGSQPVSQVTLQMLNSLIDTQTRLRDVAEARWAAAREALFNLARLVAADWLERKQHEKGGLEAIRIEELTQVVYQQVSALQTISITPMADQLQKVNEQNAAISLEMQELSARVEQGEKFRKELEAAERKIEALLGEIEHLKSQVEKLKAVPPSGEMPLSPLPAPDWFQSWAAGAGFERQSFVIRLIGDTGLARRPEIVKTFAEHFGLKTTDGAVSHTLGRLKELGFITIKDTAGTGNGAPPQVLALDRLGETAYILLAQKAPVENEYYSTRSAHSTDAHTLLVLKATNLLAAEGYEIIAKGENNISLDNGRVSSPDIVARKNGQEIHIEVERDVSKGNLEGRERKWQNAFDAGKGWVYVLCENENSQKKLVSEVNRALASGSRLQRAHVCMTNLDAIKSGKRHADGSLWVSQKHPGSQS